MSCPDCGSENLTLYDKYYYECKKCNHLIDRSGYNPTPHESHRGLCKIAGIHFTDKTFGLNSKMRGEISDETVYNYSTERLNDNEGQPTVGYRIGAWIWDKKDLIVVGEDGEEVDEFPVPEPVQFNTNSLYL